MPIRHLMVSLAVLVAASASAQPADAWFEYLEAVSATGEEKLDNFILDEVDRFLVVHPQVPQEPAALTIKARILDRDGRDHEALLTWLELTLVHPDHADAGAAQAAALRIASDKKEYRDSFDAIRDALALPRPEREDDRRFAYLELLAVATHRSIHEPILGQMRRFGQLFPLDPRQARTLELEAMIHQADGRDMVAFAVLSKAEALCPGAPAIPSVMHRRAVLLADRLGQREQALDVLASLRSEYPEHPVLAVALRDQARIKLKEDDVEGAVADLREFVTLFPEHEGVLDSLFEMATLCDGKLKAWLRADEILEEIVTRFPTEPRVVEALRGSAKLNKDQLRNPARAAAQRARVAELFPTDKGAPDDLFKAAELAIKELDDRRLSDQYLQTILATWPGTKDAEKAQKELDKLQSSG